MAANCSPLRFIRPSLGLGIRTRPLVQNLYTAAKIAAGKAAITSKSTRLSTKLDMPPDFGISYIKRLCIAMLKKVRGLRKFSCRPVASQTGELLAPRHQERQVRKFNFLCGLCAEIFRVLDAAQPALGSQSFRENLRDPLSRIWISSSRCARDLRDSARRCSERDVCLCADSRRHPARVFGR
jgi:hypothetical protein